MAGSDADGHELFPDATATSKAAQVEFQRLRRLIPEVDAIRLPLHMRTSAEMILFAGPGQEEGMLCPIEVRIQLQARGAGRHVHRGACTGDLRAVDFEMETVVDFINDNTWS